MWCVQVSGSLHSRGLTLGSVEKPARCAGADVFLSGVDVRSELLLGCPETK